MKLYELPRISFFKVVGDETMYLFDHIDGMYSVCYTLENELFHLAAHTEVELVE